jgi:gas vesicle protein
MNQRRFAYGFLIGIAAGVTAKILYDNRKEVYVVITDKAKEAKEDINDFVEYASDRVQNAKEEVSKKASDYIEMAKEQINDMKASLMTEADEAEAEEAPIE